MKSSFIIVADRGNLKAYRVEKVPNDRPPRVQLVQAFTLTGAHMKISEINTDMAGRFPQGSTPGQSQGRHQNAIAEQHNLPLEIDKRLVKQLAEHITTVLKQEQPGSWAFAAPAMINKAVVSELDPSLAKLLGDNIQSDLVNVEPSHLLEHFQGVRAA
ncbi:MAG: hypothetical protein EOP84_23760 [Verrucomicrobiaceae bacterium]|nr:MAG: hypothetical protein EOP84_23760 [Verrucomicrobiaceae bacterium]